MEDHPIVYPRGALVRVDQICRRRDGTPGLLPINRSTWYRWLKDGKVPPGRKIGENTTVWPVETVLAVSTPANDADQADAAKPAAIVIRAAAARAAKQQAAA